MGDWRAVAETAKKISSSTDRVDILVNDAAKGIMTYQLTEYGVDRHMAVNTVRIVGLKSNAHQGTPSDCKFETLSKLNTDLGPNGQYEYSKLAQMLYAK